MCVCGLRDWLCVCCCFDVRTTQRPFGASRCLPHSWVSACICVGESDESLRKKDKAIDDVFSVFFLSPPVGAPWLLPVSVSVPVCVCNFVSLCPCVCEFA